MKFTAIDFETANSSRSSACAVGLTIVDNGNVVGSLYKLIRPDPLYFSPFNVSIHGITENDVAKSPAFSEIWPELLANISGPLVAHNASFDISVIRKSLDAEGIPYPDLDYYCTQIISKLAWPNQPTYGLGHMADLLGLSFEHHNAADDSRICALLAQEACKTLGVSSLEDLVDLEEPLNFSCGRLYPGGYTYCRGQRINIFAPPSISINYSASGIEVKTYSATPIPHCSKSKPRNKLKASNIKASVQNYEDEHPFKGKSFVFTGSMTGLIRRDAMQAVVDRGGKCHDTVRHDTDFLVVAQNGYGSYREGLKSNKIRKAEAMLAKGRPIEILSESDFISLL